jgi:hypothetical protein
MSHPYELPLRIVKSGESIKVVDRKERAVAYLHFEAAELRRNLMNRWTEEEAVAIAKQIARALTDAAS